jgi:hypothetical protein
METNTEAVNDNVTLEKQITVLQGKNWHKLWSVCLIILIQAHAVVLAAPSTTYSSFCGSLSFM